MSIRTLAVLVPALFTQIALAQNTASADSVAPSVPSGVRSALFYRDTLAGTFRCDAIFVSWNASSDNAGGSGLANYKIYRNGSLRGTSSTTSFSELRYVDGDTDYLYEVSAVDRAGNESAKVGAMIRTASCYANAMGGNINVEVFMVNFPDRRDAPVTADALTRIMFNGSSSVAADFAENSYGRLAMTGSVHPDYLLMPHNIEHYCPAKRYQPSQGLDLHYDCSSPLYDDAFAAAASAYAQRTGRSLSQNANRVVFVYGGVGTVGISIGNKIHISGHGTDDSFRMVAIHELAHSYNAAHDGGWECPLPSGVGSNLPELVANGCTVGRYTGYDPMGGPVALRHFNAYHKFLLGWLDGDQVATAANNGEYRVENLELASRFSAGQRAPKFLRIPIPGSNDYYFVEYRTKNGIDAVPDSRRPEMNALRVVLRFGTARGELGAFDIDTASLINVGGYNRHGEVIPGRPFVDPYRKIRVEMIGTEDGGDTARARILFGDAALDSDPNAAVKLIPPANFARQGETLRFGVQLNVSKKISRVELLKGTKKVNSDSSAPYSLRWRVPPSTAVNSLIKFKAKVYFKDRTTQTSSEVSVTVR